jgi:hypothetical protein
MMCVPLYLMGSMLSTIYLAVMRFISFSSLCANIKVIFGALQGQAAVEWAAAGYTARSRAAPPYMAIVAHTPEQVKRK